MQLPTIVVLRIRIEVSHTWVKLILIEHLAESMIIGTQFLDLRVCAIRFMEGILERIGTLSAS